MLPAGPESQRGLLDFDILWAYALHRSHNTVIRGVLLNGLILIQRKERTV